MSDYCRQKVLRVPCEFYGIEKRLLEEKHEELFGYGDVGKFQCAPTDEADYIDYVIDEEYGADCGSFGRTRQLYDSEKEKYAPIFRQIIPNIDMRHVRLVEYCWYSCCEAPDYYDDIDDPFYDEV